MGVLWLFVEFWLRQWNSTTWKTHLTFEINIFLNFSLWIPICLEESNATAPITCSMHCRYWEQTATFLQLCKNALLDGCDVMETTRKSCFYAMERATWTRGGGEKCADPVDRSLLQRVQSNFQVGFSARSVGSGGRWWLSPDVCELSEEQQTEPWGGMVLLQSKVSVTRWCLQGVLCRSVSCRFHSH